MITNVKPKSCCITGHRDIPKHKINYVYDQLHIEIKAAVNEGYTHFMSGVADGADLYFADIIIQLKNIQKLLTLEAAVPYANRVKTGGADLKKIVKQCDNITIISDKYTPGCFMERNHYIADYAYLVIAVYDGRQKGGTYNTIKYATVKNREIHIISF